MKTKEIYSLNKIAYLIMNDMPIQIVKKQNLVYAIVEKNEQYRDIVRKYNNDKELHEFLNIYKELKNM